MPDNRFRLLLDHAPDAMVIASAEGKIEMINLRTEELFGYEREELIAKPIEVLVPERFRATHVAHRSRFAHAPKVRSMGSGVELYGRHKDGSEIPIEVSLGPLEIDGRMLVSAAIRDIRERQRLEQEAALAARRLRSAVESSLDAFALFDANDRLVLCNAKYRELLPATLDDPTGMSFDELVDASLASFSAGLDAERIAQLRERRMRNRREPGATMELVGADGRHFRVSDRRTEEGGCATTLWDVTEGFLREDELRQARAAAESASLAKSEFLASVSHELRTPMNAVLGFTQLLLRDRNPPLSARQRRMVDHVVDGGMHLLRLIDEILDLSRIEAGGVSLSPEAVGIADVLRDVATTLSPLASRAEIRLTIDAVSPDAPMIHADRTRCAQILLNFGSNAIKYGRPGGTVTLYVDLEPTLVRFRVIDDGIGIPAAKQDKIFQPFQRAGQETGPIQGTGIGLTISKRLTEMMNGRIGFTSDEGKGSEFWIELPIWSAPTPTFVRQRTLRPSEATFDASASPNASTIVYVEDNPSNVAFMEALISELPSIRLVVAPDAEAGIALVRVHRPALVLMDVNLPGMSGIEALEVLRRDPETAAIPVLALSAAATQRDRERGEQAGFARYLTKPISVEKLIEALDALLPP